MARKGRATRCGRERIPTMTESAIRARFVRDSFHSLSTGAPTAFPEAWRMLYLPDLPVAVGRTAEMRCRMGRALPAVAQLENWAVSRIFCWPITTMSCRILWRVFSPLARGLVRSTVRPRTAAPIFAAGVASFTGMHSPGTWKPMMQLRQYTASQRVPGDGNRASDSQFPVRRGVCGPWWERVSCVHRDVRAAQGAA